MKKKRKDYAWRCNKSFLNSCRVARTCICLISFIIFTCGTAHSQNMKVSLNMKNSSMLEIIKSIKSASGLKFLYSIDEIKKYSDRSIEVKDADTRELMSALLKGTDLTYEISKDVIMIKPMQAEAAKIQKYILKGKVLDEKNEPLPGVTVRLNATQVGTSTGINGEFSLTLPIDTGRLVLSFVGYKTLIINFIAGKDLVIRMQEDVADLDEVTVIAYGERTKKVLISSISSVKADDLKERPAASIETLLQGRMSGVQVTNVTGAPGGGGTQVNIRGFNSLMISSNPRDPSAKPINDGTPLYVIDGVPVNSFTSPVTGTNTMSEIDPTTIESVEVLKDAASAALYGSRASNGVILITTKKGKLGKAKFSANVSYSASILPETPYQLGGNEERLYRILSARSLKTAYWDWQSKTYKYPSSYEEAKRWNTDYDYFWNMGQSLPQGPAGNSVNRPLQDSLNPFFNNSTNWYKYTFRTGKVLNANLQASGGTEFIKYMIGAGWYSESGIMYGSDFSRFNLNMNLNATPRKGVAIDGRIYMAYTDRSRGRANTTGISPSRFEKFTIDPTTMLTVLPGGGDVLDVAMDQLNQTSEKLNSFRIRPSLTLKLNLIEGMTLSSSVAIDYTQNNRNSFQPSSFDKINNWTMSQGMVTGDIMLTNENLWNYGFSLNERHNFDFMLGLSYNRSANNVISGSGKGAPSDHIQYVGPDFPNQTTDASGKLVAMQSYMSTNSERIMLSYFGRVAYNLSQKYLTEFSLRRDGSSVFGSNVRWATFPSVAFGWNFSEESFMKNFWWLSFGKLRASWGTSGQQFSEPYLAQGTLNIGGTFLGNAGMIPTQILNKDLTWEKSEQYDVGLDLDFMDYRLKFKIDYYYKYSSSLLYPVPLPGDVYLHSLGFQNALAITNQGLELELIADIFRDTPLKWRSRLNISRNWNRFEKSSLGTDIDEYVLGRPLGGIYVFRDHGIIQSEEDVPMYYNQDGGKIPLRSIVGGPYGPGMRLIEDLNEDGQIGQEDMYYAHSTLPAAYGGWTNELSWKNFDLNLLFTFTLGRHMINGLKSRSFLFEKSNFRPIFAKFSYDDFWQNPGDDTKYPSLTSANAAYPGQFDGLYESNIESVNYLRLQQLTLGYNVPKDWLKRINIEGVRLFFTAENLFLWTNYSGLDPEVVETTTSVDYGNNYPLARKFTFGLTVNF